MKKIKKTILILTSILALCCSSCTGQIRSSKTQIAKVYGNCDLCKQTIEKAGNVNKISIVNWNKDTKLATLLYDSTKTSTAEILKRIAMVGYDNEEFLAPDDVYAKLQNCCRYDREKKTVVKAEDHKVKMASTDHALTMSMAAKTANPLTTVFDSYFGVKDALVQTDGAAVAVKSKALISAIKAVKMEKLAMDVHMIWMKVLIDLQKDAQQMADSKDIEIQRKYLMSLSKNMYALMSVAKYEEPIYYQFCPMANGGKGANWLSKENTIKNPYYGSQMLSCGRTVETIK